MIELDLQNNFVDTAELLWVLSSEIRLKILQTISGRKEYRLKDLVPILNCGVSNISQQVKILEEAGLVEKIRLKDGTTAKLIVPLYDKIKINLSQK